MPLQGVNSRYKAWAVPLRRLRSNRDTGLAAVHHTPRRKTPLKVCGKVRGRDAHDLGRDDRLMLHASHAFDAEGVVNFTCAPGGHRLVHKIISRCI